MSIFQKTTDEQGNEVYVEVDLAQIELPDDHPVKRELEEVKRESIERRLQLKALKQQKAEGAADRDEKPEPTPDAQPEAKAVVPAINPDELVEKVVEKLTARQQAELKAKQERESAIDAILRDTGLSEMFKSTIAAIPDLAVAKAEAQRLANLAKRFDQAPSGGNGRPDTAKLFANVDKKLGFIDE